MRFPTVSDFEQSLFSICFGKLIACFISRFFIRSTFSTIRILVCFALIVLLSPACAQVAPAGDSSNKFRPSFIAIFCEKILWYFFFLELVID